LYRATSAASSTGKRAGWQTSWLRDHANLLQRFLRLPSFFNLDKKHLAHPPSLFNQENESQQIDFLFSVPASLFALCTMSSIRLQIARAVVFCHLGSSLNKPEERRVHNDL
jgi:hypothetical protein